jgi:hypothetical protein
MADGEAIGSRESKQVVSQSRKACVLFNDAVVCYNCIGLTGPGVA